MINKEFGEIISKLLFLAFNIISNEHEVLGHLNTKIQRYLYDKKINSPSLENLTDLTIRKTESGEYIEMLLYGKLVSDLTINQIFFILDIENYDCICGDFRNKFSKCNSDYKPSESLIKFLNSLNIDIDTIPNNPSIKYAINQYLNKNSENLY